MRRAWLLVALLAGCDDGGGAGDAPAADAAPVDATPVDAEPDAAPADAAPADAAPADAGPDAALPLVPAAGPDQYALVDAEVVLDASATTGAVAFAWDLGDGRQAEGPVVRAAWPAPGRYRATLTATGPDGTRRTDVALISVTWPLTHTPRQSSSIAALPDGGVAVVVADADAIARVVPAGDGFEAGERTPTCRGPRTLAVWGDALAVACPADDAVWVHGAGEPLRFTFPYGARPYGVAADGDRLVVSLQGAGAVAWLAVVDGALASVARQPATPDARGVAVLPDGAVAVSRWRSPDDAGRVAVVDAEAGPRDGWTLAFDPQPPSDTEIGGVPGYLDAVLVAPTGREVALPSLQANVRHGPAFDGEEPAFDTVLRAVVSFVNLPENTEDFDARKQFDGRGLASAGVYSSHGDYLFVAMRGSQVIERLDRLAGGPAGTLLEAGYAVEGLALSADDRWLFADASLSREVRVWDVSDLRAVPRPAFRVPTVAAEPLAPALLRGKQLFNDSADPRLSREGYIACAHCHLDGDADRLVWDFTARGEGLRNTISMLGRAGRAPIHWSGNFDEIQDFEHDIRGPFGGAGLLADADFARASTPLGPPKAGLGADLDALAAYAASLDAVPRSPHRTADGGLTPAAARGAQVFTALGCDACHAGPAYTDSAFGPDGEPRLHDVGTLRPTSGQRLGGPLPGVDTPTLLGLFDGAPFLHDGSAPDLRAVLLDRNPAGLHGPVADADAADVDDLVAFLLSLDGR